ncbi:MAG: FixH family protein, partial [Pseudomonadota bacterium]|nr:FixH family protein [Pseudomonadota bacterium]
MTSEKTTPWYKEPMMLLVIGVPLAAVVWGFIMLSLALDTKDSLVSNSYYKDGMSYTQDLRFHEGARRLNVQADLTFTEDEIIVNATSIADEDPGS